MIRIERQISSQTQAEGGIDNTTVMSPLATTNFWNKIKTVAQSVTAAWTFSAPATDGEIVAASFKNISNVSAATKVSISFAPDIADNVKLIAGRYAAGATGGGSFDIQTKQSGTGTLTSRLFIDNFGNIGIGTNSFGLNAAGVLGIKNGTAPISSPITMFQMFSADLGGFAVPHFMLGDGITIVQLNQNLSTTSSPIFNDLTLSSFTAGSVLFAGASGAINQNNANLFWDDTNNRLGIGTAAPAQKIHLQNAGTDNYLKIDAGGTAANISGILLSEHNINFGWSLRHNAGTDDFSIDTQDNALTFTNVLQFSRTNRSIGVGTSAPPSILGGFASPAFNVTQLITNNPGLPVLTNFTTAGGRILIMVTGTGWNTGAATPISVDINVDGTTVHTMNIQPSLQTASHRTLPSAYIVRTGLASGTHNISFVLNSGNVDLNDRWNVTIMELPF